MTYQPKSKYKILKTAGREYVFKGTEKFHIGSYIQLSNGKFFEGNNITDRGLELVPFKPLPSNFRNEVKTQIYNKLKPQKFQFLKNAKPIINTKPQPTKKDYTKGSFIRYFAKRNNNEVGYIEISKDTYSAIFKKKKSEYDYYLYSVGKITWALEGDVVNTNSNIIKLKEKTFPYLSEFFDMLDQYKKVKKAKHNIKGRTYNNGVGIPSNLPPSYGLPKTINQFCNNCKFKNNKYCNNWDINIRTEYWCKSWVNSQKIPEGSFDDVKTFDEVKIYDKITKPTLRSSTDIQTSGGSGGTSYSGGGGY